MKSKALFIDISDGHITLKADTFTSNPIHKQAVWTPKIKPILKWAGGKQWLSLAACQFAPPDWSGRYFEPFLGGASFFFALEPGEAVLSDTNKELIRTYASIRRESASVIKLLSNYPYDKDFYYKLRLQRPQSPIRAAARLIYLNRTCWNGLYRLNRAGHFNTPFGNFTNPSICDSERIQSAGKLLKRARLGVGDYSRFVLFACRGDFVYLDPPYITAHYNNGFLRYNSKLFSWPDQERLALSALELNRRGVYVLMSNADHPSVVSMYHGFYYYKVLRNSLIAGPISARGVITEALLSNYPLLGWNSEVI